MNAPQETPRPRRAEAGFTLVEIMVVIVILGLLATMVATNVMQAGDDAKIQTTQTSLKTISQAVEMFYLNNSKLPQDVEELLSEEVKGGPFLKDGELNDAWGNKFVLRGETRKDYEVISLGPDGSENTEDDLSSRKKKE